MREKKVLHLHGGLCYKSWLNHLHAWIVCMGRWSWRFLLLIAKSYHVNFWHSLLFSKPALAETKLLLDIVWLRGWHILSL
jgi:hypothetical protein